MLVGVNGGDDDYDDHGDNDGDNDYDGDDGDRWIDR